MRGFPAEFSQLLNAKGRRLAAQSAANGRSAPCKLSVTDGIMDRAMARACIELLDRHLYPRLRPMVQRIPPSATWGMKKNYSEKLPKTVSVKTCHLRSGHCLGYAEAEKAGLIGMLRSQSLHRFAQSVTGLKLEHPALQVICYEHGDYSGPHNDHHPEFESTRDGFVDLHIMFSNDAVAHQWLVYEENGHLSKILDANLQGAVSVYRLPFWHYTTPLVGKPGREKNARRWLLLVTFDIVRRSRRGKRKTGSPKRVQARAS